VSIVKEYSLKETIAAIRKAVKTAFPSVRFNVRPWEASEGWAIDVRYHSDRLLHSDVEKVIDLYRSRIWEAALYGDEGHWVWKPKVHPETGQSVSWGATFIRVEQQRTEDLKTKRRYKES
jgi:hypothetical protein